MDYANKRRNDELIIDLKELFWRLLEQWRAILVFAIIIALLFSGAMYMRSSSKAEEETVIKTPDEIMAALGPDDQEIVMGAFSQKDARDRMQKYVSEAPLMSLDAFNVNCLTMTWMVSSEKEINKQLVAAYINELVSYDVASAVNKAWGDKYDTDDVRELFKSAADIPLETGADLESNLLKLSVYLPEDDDADMAMKAVDSLLPGITEKLSSSVGDHSIKLIDSDVQVIADTSLSDAQYNVFNRLYNLNYQLNYLMKNVLTSKQKAAYEALITYDEAADEIGELADDAEKVAAPEPQTSKPKFLNKKRLALGFILGGLLYCGLYLLYFAFSGKALSPKVLEESYGLRTLGEWHSEDKKGMLTFLTRDGFVYRKHHKGHTSLDMEVDRISGSIVNFFEGKEGRKLLLVSNSNASESAGTLIEALKKKLAESSITTEVAETDPSNGIYLGENILSSGDAAALLIDQKNSSLKDVNDVCEKIGICGIPFAGVAYAE